MANWHEIRDEIRTGLNSFCRLGRAELRNRRHRE